MSDDAPTLLRSIEWFTEPPLALPEHIGSWLMETGSMTKRLESYCTQLTVMLCTERFVTPYELGDECDHLPPSEHYWLREVVLYGDKQPWLFGRTLVPRQTLDGAGSALKDIGTEPLGRYLFRYEGLTRDYIHTGCGGGLWARRSRLRLSGSPFLLTELFLPGSPLYSTVSL